MLEGLCSSNPCRFEFSVFWVFPEFHIAFVFLRVSAALLQGAYSHTGKHMRGQRMRQKIASREGRVSSVFAPRPLAGARNTQNSMVRAGFSSKLKAQERV